MAEHKGGRARTGGLLWKSGKWYGRWTAEVEGETLQVVRSMNTTSKPVARRRLERAMAEGAPGKGVNECPETFEEAARRVVEAQKRDGSTIWKDRLHRLETYAFPEIGRMVPVDVTVPDVKSVLEVARDSGKAYDTLAHLRADMSVVLRTLREEGTIADNACHDLSIPKVKKETDDRSQKERAVLTDVELMIYLCWQHPVERYQMAVLERQTMSCVARMLGGQRTSDLHAIRWEAFELPRFNTEGVELPGGFAVARVPNRKTGKPRPLAVPEMLRPILHDWWERHGRPQEGLLFPARAGRRAGEPRKHTSHAQAFRRDLEAAFRAELEAAKKQNREPLTPKPGSQRWAQLFTETTETRPVDFHSWRRAFSKALAEAGLNEQQAMALTGHETSDAYRRYIRDRQRLRELPPAALPRLTLSDPEDQKQGGQEGEAATEPSTFSSVGVVGFEPTTAGTQSHQVGGIIDVLAERACKQGPNFSQIQEGATEQIRPADLIASGSCNAVAWWERALQCSLAARATELAGRVDR